MKKSYPLIPLYPPQMSHEGVWDRNMATAVRSRRITAWTMAQPPETFRWELEISLWWDSYLSTRPVSFWISQTCITEGCNRICLVGGWSSIEVLSSFEPPHTAVQSYASCPWQRHGIKRICGSVIFSFSLSVAWLPYKSVLRLRMLGAEENSPQILVRFSCHYSVAATVRIWYTRKVLYEKKGNAQILIWITKMLDLLGCCTVVYGRIQTFRCKTFRIYWGFKLQQTPDKTVFGYNVKKLAVYNCEFLEMLRQ
jgi:hypothetical protein